MYKYETHMHTREASACAWSTGAEMAEKYKAEGYTGIIVTDHFFNGNSAIPRDLPWKERIELYCKGYENAKARGDQIGLDVFFGFEYGDGGSDFLVYGLDKQWLIENDHILDIGLDKQWLIENDHILDIGLTSFLEYARSCGGFIVHAHPFRDYEYIRSTVHAPHFVDAVEGVNASHSRAGHHEFNDRAKLFAEWYGLPTTGGSDSHNTADKWYGGGVLSEKKFSSVMDYAAAVAERKVVCIDN